MKDPVYMYIYVNIFSILCKVLLTELRKSHFVQQYQNLRSLGTDKMKIDNKGSKTLKSNEDSAFSKISSFKTPQKIRDLGQEKRCDKIKTFRE